MSGDLKPRSVLSDLRKPLLQAPASISPALEERLLGGAAGAGFAVAFEPPPDPVAPAMPGPVQSPARKKVPTVPVTFHLPVDLRDKIKVTAQAKQMTMLEIAVDALNGYLAQHPVSESDLRRLLGL